MMERFMCFYSFIWHVYIIYFKMQSNWSHARALGLHFHVFLQTSCLQYVYCDSFGRGERSDPLSGMDCTLNIHSNPVFWFSFNTRSSEGCWAAVPQWSCLSIQKQAGRGTWFIYSVYCLLFVLDLREWINFLQISPHK